MTLPTLHSNFDPNWTSRVGAVLDGSFRVPFWVPESGRYTIAKVSDCDSDCRFGIIDHGNNKGGGGRKKRSESRFEASRPLKRAAEDGPFWAILTIP